MKPIHVYLPENKLPNLKIYPQSPLWHKLIKDEKRMAWCFSNDIPNIKNPLFVLHVKNEFE